MDRQDILGSRNSCPEPAISEHLVMDFCLKAKLDRAEAGIARNEIVSHEEVVRRSQEWFIDSSRDLAPILESR